MSTMSEGINKQDLTMSQSSNGSDNQTDLSITKETLTNGYEYTKIMNNNTSSKRRKLILHFDNRNTLQVVNKVSETTIEQGVNNFLTGVLWGYEKEDGKWEWISQAPSLHKPANCSRCITYFKYLENQIVKEADDRKHLRVKTGNFTFDEEGSRFRQYYDELIELLRYHSLDSPERSTEDQILEQEAIKAQETKNESTLPPENFERKRRKSILHNTPIPVNGIRSSNGTLYHYILPSFFRLIKYLQATNRDFVIYLRTMGDDSSNFLSNAERVLSNEHPAFKFKKSLTINTTPGHFVRNQTPPPICLQMKFQDDPDVQNITDEFAIHEKLESGEGIHAIKDDFKAWQKTNYHYTTSKPVWFDPDDLNPSSHHILFDDNFRVIDPHDAIVDIRIMDKKEHKCYSCSFQYYPKLDNVFAVQADLYSILTDRDYYIKKVDECERNLDALLQNAELLKEIKQNRISDQ